MPYPSSISSVTSWKADAADGQHHLGRQLFIALEAAGVDGVAHRLFDFALRGDADLLEKSAQAGVEDVFVHDDLPVLRPRRIVQHVFAEIALAAVGARVGVGALDVAVLAAGDIFGRAGRDIVGAAERVVVAAGIDHGRLSALEAAGEQRRDDEQSEMSGRAELRRMLCPFVQFRHCRA